MTEEQRRKLVQISRKLDLFLERKLTPASTPHELQGVAHSTKHPEHDDSSPVKHALLHKVQQLMKNASREIDLTQ